jgi:predicted metal-dependent peptidase
MAKTTAWTDLNPQQKMEKAFDQIVLKERFFAVLKSQMKWVPDPTAKTAWTNGKMVGWNPKFIETLSVPEATGLCVHEISHPMYKHHLRRGDREQKLWNIACDYAINLKIIDWGFRLPKGALVKDIFKNMPAEQIYDILLKEQCQKQQQQRQQKDSEEDSQEDQADDQSQDGEPGEGEPDGQPKDGESEDGDQDGEPGEGDKEDGQEGESEEDDIAGTNSDDGPEEEKEEEEGAHGGSGSGKAKPSDDEDPDPGNCGEVRDAVGEDGEPATDEEKEAQSHEWNVAITQAESIAKIAKQLGNGLKRSVGEILHPEVPWEEVLQAFMNERSRDDYSWMRPSRRGMGSGVHLPSLSSRTIGAGVLVIDSSGSIDGTKYNKFISNVKAVLETFELELFVIIADDHVQWSGYVTADRLDELEMKGYGGTDFRPAFELVDEEGIDPKFLIYFTDMENWLWPTDPGYPVLWACWGNYPQPAPFGELLMVR